MYIYQKHIRKRVSHRDSYKTSRLVWMSKFSIFIRFSRCSFRTESGVSAESLLHTDARSRILERLLESLSKNKSRPRVRETAIVPRAQMSRLERQQAQYKIK